MATLCTFDGCGRPLYCKGLCTAHDMQRRRGAQLHPIGEKKPKKVKPPCSFPGCVHQVVARGLCPGHRMQKLAGHELTPLRTARSRTPEPHPEIPGAMRVPLTHGKFAIIDAGDAEAVAEHIWRIQSCDGRFYASTTIGDEGSGKHTLTLHRMLWSLWGMPPTPTIDHHDGDGLNCRRKNLRAATQSQNNYNAKLSARNTSGHKGVTWDKRNAQWMAHLKCEGKDVYLGRFDDLQEAVRVRREAAERLHGEFVRHE